MHTTADAPLPLVTAAADLPALPVPDLSRQPLRHALAYAASGWLSPWSGDALAEAGVGIATAWLPAAPGRQRAWQQAFGCSAGRAPVYLGIEPVVAVLQRRLLAQAGVPPGSARLLRQQLHRARDAAAPQDQALLVLCRQTGVGQLASGWLMADVETSVVDAQGRRVATQHDRLALPGIDTAGIAHLPRDRAVMADFACRLDRTPRLDPREANITETRIGTDWGRRYARLAGAWAPAHWLGGDTWPRWLGRALGEDAGTWQPTALLHLVRRHLADTGLLPERLEIVHCRPVRLGQRVRTVQCDGRFEVLDEQQRLLAHGSC